MWWPLDLRTMTSAVAWHAGMHSIALSQKAFKRKFDVWCPLRVTEQAVWRCLQQAGLLDQDSEQSARETETTVPHHRCPMQFVAVVMRLCNHSTTLLAY